MPAKAASLSPPGSQETAVDIDQFVLSPETLQGLVDPKSLPKLQALGGTARLASLLHTSLSDGLPCGTSDPPTPARRTQTPVRSEPEDPFILLTTREERQRIYGNNVLPPPPVKSLGTFMLETMSDKTLIVLSIAAVLSLGIGIYKSVKPGSEDRMSWVEGIAILAAVCIVVLVNSVNDYRKQSQFRKLNEARLELSHTQVIRKGVQSQVPVQELLVGDIALVETGDVLAADGIMVQGFGLTTDESAMTGESVSIRKTLAGDPFLLSGTKVVAGMGRMLVIAVGPRSMHGKSMMGCRTAPEDTPLQVKLTVLAERVAQFGLSAAILCVLALLVIYFVQHPLSGGTTHKSPAEIADDVVSILITGVTIVVVAVPEGLPLAVTLALAYGTIKMLKDKNLVRVLSACETMGGATTICSDKTGTLTQNKMSVVKGVLCGGKLGSAPVPKAILKLATASLNINSTAYESKRDEWIGMSTEIALLEFTKAQGSSYAQDRAEAQVVHIVPFSSERKRMCTVVSANDLELPTDSAFALSQAWEGSAMPFPSRDAPSTTDTPGLPTTLNATGSLVHCYSKGAAEIVLKHCTHMMNEEGELESMTPEVLARCNRRVASYASRGLRTIGFSYKPMRTSEYDPFARALCASSLKITESPESEPDSDSGLVTGAHAESESHVPAPDIQIDEFNMILLGLVGIADPVRPEVPAAVAQCQASGIVVRMVTGDNVHTARSIAQDCGILTTGGLVLEGPQFRALSEAAMRRVLPRLQVLARSSPHDKQILVGQLKSLGETVAVTGDGTNDAPALKMSDVGFAMGLSGTEVAKEASDIVLMDDNFASIINAILWGRSVYDSVQKFLQFQLTVNIVAVLLTIITGIHSALIEDLECPDGDGKPEAVLKAVQLLWVNLIMDTFAALALATEEPSRSVLSRRPIKKSDPLISADMWRMILGQAAFQLAIFLILYFCGPELFGHAAGSLHLGSIVFNAFVLTQLFNEVNARILDRSTLNVFAGLSRNRMFLGIWAGTLLAQVVIVQFGGEAFKTTALTLAEWAVCLAIGAMGLVVGVLIRVMPVDLPCGSTHPGRDLSRAPSKGPQKPHDRDSASLTVRDSWLVTEAELHPGNPDARAWGSDDEDPGETRGLMGASLEPRTRSEHLWHRLALNTRVVAAFRRYRRDNSDALVQHGDSSRAW